eukprot:COSAG01_NODE_64505_length_275_cov_0.762712_1_plen_27_part_10
MSQRGRRRVQLQAVVREEGTPANAEPV